MSVLKTKGIILGHDGQSEEAVFCFDTAAGTWFGNIPTRPSCCRRLAKGGLVCLSLK
jgi:hypothetical protein